MLEKILDSNPRARRLYDFGQENFELISTKETLIYVYHTVMFEWHLMQKTRHEASLVKHRREQTHFELVVKLRKTLSKI